MFLDITGSPLKFIGMKFCACAADSDRKPFDATYQTERRCIRFPKFCEKVPSSAATPHFATNKLRGIHKLRYEFAQLGFTAGYKHITQGKLRPAHLAKINSLQRWRLAAAFTK
jgi:hypothetical protein